MIKCQDLNIPGAKLITLTRYSDERGWLNEIWRDEWIEQIGIEKPFIQNTVSWNKDAYTLRGLHALSMPMVQSKLISVANGSIFDVIVDARKGSPTYGQHLSVTLSSDAPQLLLVPANCYHGYLTLVKNTTVSYKVSQYHDNAFDSGIAWNDPDLDIKWPLNGNNPIISIKDQSHSYLKDL